MILGAITGDVTYGSENPTSIRGFNGEYRFLSNFYEGAPVTVDGIEFRNSEAAYQAGRARTPLERLVFTSLDPATARKVAHHGIVTRENWKDVRLERMRTVVSAKFNQNLGLAWQLVQTGDAELVESNDWHDNFWGDCVCSECKDVEGQNMLGKVLMEVRDELRAGVAKDWPLLEPGMGLAGIPGELAEGALGFLREPPRKPGYPVEQVLWLDEYDEANPENPKNIDARYLFLVVSEDEAVLQEIFLQTGGGTMHRVDGLGYLMLADAFGVSADELYASSVEIVDAFLENFSCVDGAKKLAEFCEEHGIEVSRCRF